MDGAQAGPAKHDGCGTGGLRRTALLLWRGGVCQCLPPDRLQQRADLSAVRFQGAPVRGAPDASSGRRTGRPPLHETKCRLEILPDTTKPGWLARLFFCGTGSVGLVSTDEPECQSVVTCLVRMPRFA